MVEDTRDDALAELQARSQSPHLPTQLTYELRKGVAGEGPRAYDWSDKPHRLVYDACMEIERLTGDDRAARLEEALKLFVRLTAQVRSDLASAHAEICRLQGLMPQCHRWPDWSAQANTLRWMDELDEAARAALA